MVSSIVYSGDGTTRIFPVDFKILGENFVRVYVDDVEVTDKRKYDIINNSIVFNEEETPQIGQDNVTIIVATSESELGELGAPLTDIVIVAQNIADINAVRQQVVPNLPEILLADDNATIATQKALEASNSATSASESATIATTKAGEALTSANNASTSEANALAYRDTASTHATTATTQAGIATTKAEEASASASDALTSRNQAKTFAQQAQDSAVSFDAANLVHKTGNETIAGIKTYTSSPIVPTPTNATEVANKAYVDTKSLTSGGTINGTLTVNGAINGTAVTQSNTDATAGRLLKVGDFGIGTGDTLSREFSINQDFNSFTKSGMLFVGGNGNLNTPTGLDAVSATLLVNNNQVNRDHVSQLAIVDTNTMFFRYGSAATGIWQPWREIYHTGNSKALTETTAPGIAPVYACRAWVNFNGTGTVAIRASGNVSSVTDNGTGDYTVNFATAMPDANYVANTVQRSNSYTGGLRSGSCSTTSVRLTYYDINGLIDREECGVSIFR